MTRYEKRVAKMRKEHLAKVKVRDERIAKEQEKARLEAEKAKFAELQKLAKEQKVKDFEKMNAEELEKALEAVKK